MTADKKIDHDHSSDNPTNCTPNNLRAGSKGKFARGVLVAIVAAPFVALIGFGINSFISRKDIPYKAIADKHSEQRNGKTEIMNLKTYMHPQLLPLFKPSKTVANKGFKHQTSH